MKKLHLGDLKVGIRHELGTATISEEDIIDFAKRYDPQPFHIDVDAAKSSIYGGVIASGWQTLCVYSRLFVDGFLNNAAAMGSPGLDEIQWLRPVRPGTLLRASVEVIETRPSRSKPDRGIARLRCVMEDQDHDQVLVFIANVLFQSRETG